MDGYCTPVGSNFPDNELVYSLEGGGGVNAESGWHICGEDKTRV